VSRPGAGLRLLVAEDNEANQLVARRMIERLGHDCEIAGDGRQALEALARHKFDAVLMDCQMPDMDGFTVTQRIRAGEVPGVNPNIPIIAVTAYAMQSDRQQCLDAGMDEHLTKPVRIEALRDVLVRCGLLGETTAPAVVQPKPAEPTLTIPPEVLEPAQLAMLRELPGSEHDSLLDELVPVFLRETAPMPAKLRELADQRAWGDVVRLAHRLAGSCANLGARSLRQAALGLEKAAQAGQTEEAQAQLAALDREWERLRYLLQRLWSTSHENPHR
jgi:CheY-like chemotaxis protein